MPTSVKVVFHVIMLWFNPKSRFDASSDIFISSQSHETENFNRKQNHPKRTAFECCDYYTNYSYKYPSCHFPQHEYSKLFQAFILSIHILLYIHVSFIVAVGHCSVVIIGAMASQFTSLMIVYSTVYSGADQRKHQSSALLAFLRWFHRWPMNSPHKGPVAQKMFSIDDVITIKVIPMVVPHTCFELHGFVNNTRRFQ